MIYGDYAHDYAKDIDGQLGGACIDGLEKIDENGI